MLDKPEELETGGPYIGPRPFERNDRNLFFARDRETIQIISLILSNPLTLVYSQSGVGKTSLFNAKILHELEEQYKFETFPPARVRSLLTPDEIPEHVHNVYMLNALQSLNPDISLETLKNHTLSSFLKEYSPKRTNVEDTKSSVPRVIVFDQLEELFNLYPENWHDQQRDFFQQIAEALSENPMLRIAIVIREEYLAHLSAFAYLLPGRLRARFRLERLDKEGALLAVTEPLKQTGCSFAPGVAEKLVNDLLTMRVENIFGKIVNMKGQYVEPVHLQVVCQRLWMKIIHSGITEITQEHLKGSADINKALTEFYLDAISDAARQSGIRQDAIRKWFDEKLITSSGTRGIVHREAKSTGGIPNNVVDILQSRYLIRQEWHSGSRWYELTHDRLIEPIIESNKEWNQWKQKKKNRKIIMTTGGLAAATIVVAILVSAYYYYTYAPSDTLVIDQRIVPMGLIPNSVAINPNTNLLYVTHRTLNTTSVIDGTTNNVVANVNVGRQPMYVAINPNTNMIYVANYRSDSVSVIDGTTNNVVANVTLGRQPISIDINPNTNMIYVANYRSQAVSVIDGTTNNVVANVNVGTEPSSIAVNPNTNMIYVVNFRSHTISVIDGTTNSEVSEIDVSGNVIDDSRAIRFVAINPDTNMIYTSNRSSDSVSVIDGTTNNVVADIAVHRLPESLAVNPNTNMIYVAHYWTDSVSVIDATTNSVLTEVIVGSGPNFVTSNPNTNRIYVTNGQSNNLSIIDLIRTESDRCFLIECLAGITW